MRKKSIYLLWWFYSHYDILLISTKLMRFIKITVIFLCICYLHNHYKIYLQGNHKITAKEPKVVFQKCSLKKVFLKISQNSQGNICALFSNKVAGFQACNFIKKWLRHRGFPVNIAKFVPENRLKHRSHLALASGNER